MSNIIECPVRAASNKSPEDIAIVVSEDRYTYSEFEFEICKVAASIQELGYVEGERVAVFSKNSFELAVFIFAAQRLGISLVFLNPRLDQSIWTQQLELSCAEIIFFSQSMKTQIEQLKFKQLSIESLFEQTETYPVAEIDLDRESCVIFTSGSSGVGKGVRLSVRNHVSSAIASNAKTNLKQGDTWLVSLPMYHVGGLEILYRTCCAGARALLDLEQGAKRLKELMSVHDISHVSLVPSQLSELLAIDRGAELCKKLSMILIGGAATDSKLIQKLLELKLSARTCYGMSETASHITMMQDNPEADEYLSSGTALDGIEISFTDSGEILLRGEHLFMGYLGGKPRRASEWFSTGDAGKLDEKGNLRVLGRIDNTIISGGENIDPRVIEDAAKTFAYLKDCAVIPVKCPKWGHRPKLFVEWEAENKEKELRVLLQEVLPKIMQPELIESLEKLPRTAIGKVDYRSLKNSQ